MDINALLNQVYNWAAPYMPKLATSLIVLIIGWWIVGILTKISKSGMKRAKIDESLRHFLASLIGMSLKVLLVITVASMLGIEMTSFVAILAAAGFAIGLALQGSLSNFAGGVLILLFKPFKVGDVIETSGVTGKVKEIQIFNTILNTPDNKKVIMPNGAVSNGTITNFTTEGTRRCDMTFGIGYDDDIKKAKQVLEKIVKADKRILKEPEPQIVVGELGDSSVNFYVRSWVKTADYWGVYFDTMETVKLTFDKNKIGIPYPQMDVHLKKN